MNALTLLMILALLVIGGLSAVAVYYLLQVRAMNAGKQEQLRQIDLAKADQRHRLNKSIQVIAQGMLDEQLTLTEGAIRISVLLEGLQVSDSEKEKFAAFFHLAKATDHIPILERWKSLTPNEQRQFDRQREKLEKDHREFVLDAAARIRDSQF